MSSRNNNRKTPNDITKTGPLNYRDLQSMNLGARVANDEDLEYLQRFQQATAGRRAAYESSFDITPRYDQSVLMQQALQQGKDDYWGDSYFDEETARGEELERLGDIRAENQPWYSQIGNGLAKGVVLAGTTFLDGTMGLALGATQAIAEGRFSALWDNEFSKTMQQINDLSEEILPNYYTQDEIENPWDHVFNANFIGDKFIKNLGFTVGAFYSGNLVSGGIKGTGKLAMASAKRLGAGIKTVKGIANTTNIVATGVGALTSAVNEGRIEALNNSRDWFNLYKAQLDDDYAGRVNAIKEEYFKNANKSFERGPEGGLTDPAYIKMQQDILKARSDYEKALNKLSENRLKMGNADLLMNIPILMASNIVQFGKLYGNGFKTARKLTNVVKGKNGYAAGTTKLGAAYALTKGALSEGAEEISQRAASTISGIAYGDDVTNFYKAKTDNKAVDDTINWTKAVAQGINETVNDGSAWEEFFIGSLTGLLGMPSFRSSRAKDGTFQSPIYLREGAYGAYKAYVDNRAREEQIVNYLNSRINSPEFKNYYQGMVRHNKYQNDMNVAVDNGSEFDFKNAEHAQMVSDIIMFNEAGKIEDLKEAITEASGTSREDLESIVRNTTTKLEDGTLIGPFSEYASTDENGNIVANFGSDESVQEMANKITKNRDTILNTIKNYQSIKDRIVMDSNGKLSDEQVSELTWMRSQVDNWFSRAESMSDEIKSVIGDVIGNLEELSSFGAQLMSEEGSRSAELSEYYKLLDKNTASLRTSINSLTYLRSLPSESLISRAAANPKFINTLIEQINKLDDTVLDSTKKKDITNKLNDIIKIGDAIETYNKKFKEYTENPQKQLDDHAKADAELVQNEIDKKSKNVVDKLRTAKDVKSLRDIVDNLDDDETAMLDNALSTLESENPELVKNYKDTSRYANDVRRAINNLAVEPSAKLDGLTLFATHYNHSNTFSEVSNPNSVYIDEENTVFDENDDAETSYKRYTSAKYVVQKAMDEVNRSDAFKGMFSEEEEDPKDTVSDKAKEVKKDTTGDSEVTVVPATGKSNIPSPEIPVGNVALEVVDNENKELNDNIETPKPPKEGTTAKYYKPSIPETHIEAGKEGDFRPFDVVVKEREGSDYTAMYEYLKSAGAFSYLNEGNLHIGDEIGFMIDPEFEDRIKDESWHKEPIIFLVDKKSGTIVGSLDEKNAANYEGLKELRERIIKEYNGRDKSHNRPFIASPTTKVSKVMIGKVPYSSSEENLKKILEKQSDKKPLFAIIKNGTFVTNGRVDGSKILGLNDMSNKEGRLYLLIPNGAGTYSPVAVRVKHFNRKEFDIDTTEVADTLFGKEIKRIIESLSIATSQADISSVMSELSNPLYTQDVMVTWFDAAAGSGIVISRKVRNPDGTYKTVTIDGKEHIEENKYSVYFQDRKTSVNIGGVEVDSDALQGQGANALNPGTPRNPQDIYNEILNILYSFNLPLQVSTGRINTEGYNNRIINSNILTSNITSTSTVSTWFTTDYFDNEGNRHEANNPASKPITLVTPDTIEGVPIQSVFSRKTYYIDLKTNTIRDNQGRVVPINDGNRILLDLAWAQNLYGNATISTNMVDNKIITPSGKVLDRTTQKYLNNEEAEKFKKELTSRIEEIKNKKEHAESVVSSIYENQKRVDKDRTDSDYYYILEDDGEYHPYSRVHSRIGSNWVESPKQTEALNLIKELLEKYSKDENQYTNYLKNLENKYHISLNDYYNKIDKKSRDEIVIAVRDVMSGTNSRRALDAGTSVDNVIRQFFTIDDVSTIVKPDNMEENAFVELISSLTRIKSNMELMGERFLTDNIVLFQKYPDGSRIAGEVDILAVDNQGNFKIYDVKTSKYSFGEFIDRYGHKVNYFENASNTQMMSQKEYYTLQLSAYKNLFESQYNTPITTLGIMPFVLEYNKGNKVSSITSEKGIRLTYNPSVNVPLISARKSETSAPITNAISETHNPTELLSDNHKTGDKNETVGYFEIDGVVYKGYITPLTTIEGVQLYITKIPNMSKGMGNAEEYVAFNSYYAVFPNGKTFKAVPSSGNMTLEEIKDAVSKLLNSNPQRVKSMAAEKPLISVEEKPAHQESNEDSSYIKDREQAAEEVDDEFDDELLLRERDSTQEFELWNREEELEWLSKVLPQLSTNERLKIVEGLIRVGNEGATAWGMFNKGIITLSDISARGTTYHEAFHAVFHLLLNSSERLSLLDEYRSKSPEMDNTQLEEEMAEDFREFVMQGGKDTRSLGRKIIDFFKSLFIKTKYWKDFRPSSMYYFRKITNGGYSERELTSTDSLGNRDEKYSKEYEEILKNAPRDSQGRLLASNGSPSNLTERQYAQVRTKAFKDWFGDWENDPKNASKVVDENGEPLIVYHESPNIFNVFDTSKKRYNVHEVNGIWASAINRKGKGYGENIYPLFINLRKPIRTSIKQVTTIVELRTLENKALKNNSSDGAILNTIDKFGYETQYYVKNPNQVKSATDNIGTFSTENDDIRFKRTNNLKLFDSLSAEEKEILTKKGWTEQRYNSISQEERDHLMRCIRF